MRTKRMTALVAAAITAATLFNAPVAQAEEVGSPTAASAADGRLHAYHGFDYKNYCGSWEGNSSHWGSCRNTTSSLWNNGYPGNLDDVRVYWGLNHSGAHRGVRNGMAFANLSHWYFDADTGAGSGQTLNNNISSHMWINL
ncbi:hypothetical protein GCM10007079_20190 [Nocardiopsis terrae]|uniref:Peptidase inhibitor family I36 n=1 Tax=Nocardiopsis terrae TaxID=372655 RepID=A0ABR9HH62_9ACTN|nr:hypothetical protein [Nocardiopsis terrae]MBE1458365.1 hypothetical protein [Nocardiopsis terrae]GHC80900.1 hypothetical protein GCM10007079_20190 [Nocardiopsis terrae]